MNLAQPWLKPVSHLSC